MIMRIMATALIQWVTRTQAGWMTARAGSAVTRTWSWVASMVIVRLRPSLARLLLRCAYSWSLSLWHADVIAPAIDVATQLRDDRAAGCSLLSDQEITRSDEHRKLTSTIHVQNKHRQFLRGHPRRAADQARHAA